MKAKLITLAILLAIGAIELGFLISFRHPSSRVTPTGEREAAIFSIGFLSGSAQANAGVDLETRTMFNETAKSYLKNGQFEEFTDLIDQEVEALDKVVKSKEGTGL